MLTASEEQKEELEKRIRKLKEDERDRADELERSTTRPSSSRW